MEDPPFTRYMNAVALCNSLALLASQGTEDVYRSRMSLLKFIQKRWMKGRDHLLNWRGSAETDSGDDTLPAEGFGETHSGGTMKFKVETDPLSGERLLKRMKDDGGKVHLSDDFQNSNLENDQPGSRDLKNDIRKRCPVSTTSIKKRRTRATKRMGKDKISAVAETTADYAGDSTSEYLRAGVTSAEKTEFDLICSSCGLHLTTYDQLKLHKEQEHGRCGASETDQQTAPLRPPPVAALDSKSPRPVKRKHRSSAAERTCPFCTKLFLMKCELEKHLMVHTGEKPHMCSVCGKSFRLRSTLTIHTKIHTGDKRHSCQQCGKSFVQSSGLKDHLAVHSRERAHICSICGKDFVRITKLTYHMRSHTGEKPYCCAICGKKFAVSRQLNIHTRIHSDEFRYSCDVCAKKFKFKGGLNRHMRLHQAFKPFSCKICSKVFTQSGNLRIHMRTHTGEKPYFCVQCGEKFSHKPTFKKHLEGHTVGC